MEAWGEAGSGNAVADYCTDPLGLCPGVLANLGPLEKSPLLQPWGWRSSHSRATVGTQSLSGLGVAADRVERNKWGVGLGRRGGVGVEWGQVRGWNRGRLTGEGAEWGGSMGRALGGMVERGMGSGLGALARANCSAAVPAMGESSAPAGAML